MIFACHQPLHFGGVRHSWDFTALIESSFVIIPHPQFVVACVVYSFWYQDLTAFFLIFIFMESDCFFSFLFFLLPRLPGARDNIFLDIWQKLDRASWRPEVARPRWSLSTRASRCTAKSARREGAFCPHTDPYRKVTDYYLYLGKYAHRSQSTRIGLRSQSARIGSRVTAVSD